MLTWLYCNTKRHITMYAPTFAQLPLPFSPFLPLFPLSFPFIPTFYSGHGKGGSLEHLVHFGLTN